MNRRSFLKRTLAGLVGAAVATVAKPFVSEPLVTLFRGEPIPGQVLGQIFYMANIQVLSPNRSAYITGIGEP